MRMHLKSNEYIRHETNIHFIYFVFPLVALIFGSYLIWRGEVLMRQYNWWSWRGVTLPLEAIQVPLMIFGALICVPFIQKWMFNKTKRYLITNERIYVKRGILNTIENEIPLSKVNDIEIKANFIERIFNTGTVVILTGNDSNVTIPNVADPNMFKQCALNKF